eukprot:scaffold164662_cov12-Tisochrysis_lutea.AAC.1
MYQRQPVSVSSALSDESHEVSKLSGVSQRQSVSQAVSTNAHEGPANKYILVKTTTGLVGIR